MLSDEETDEGVAVSGRLLGFLVLGIALVFIGVAVLVVASVFLGGGKRGRHSFDWSDSDCFWRWTRSWMAHSHRYNLDYN